MPDRSVLHVLPHPGGGGQTYVDTLVSAADYRTTTTYLASDSKAGMKSLARAIARVVRLARKHDLLHVHGESAGALLLPLVARGPSILTLHGLHLYRRAGSWGRLAAGVNLRALSAAADRIICVSASEHHAFETAVGREHARRAVVIRNGTHIPAQRRVAAREAIRRKLGLDGRAPVGIWIGSLDERRDPVTAVCAAERAAIPLLVVGEGSLAPEAKRHAREHARLLGHHHDVAQLLEAGDFFVLLSRREGLSLAVLEAMAHGLPPIVVDIPENREAVGDAGMLVPFGDKSAVAAAFRYLADNPAERARLGLRARHRASEHFNAETMIRRTTLVYDDVLANY